MENGGLTSKNTVTVIPQQTSSPTETRGNTPKQNGNGTIPHSKSCLQSRIAVEVRGLEMNYGSGKKSLKVLKGINLTAPEGAIYGLLGPSGCGKTTLLRCVVGRLKPRVGRIRVFGRSPNAPDSQVPGAAVGYMPQDIALYPEITIGETLIYFGKLYRLKDKTLKERMAFLLNFLDLPDRARIVGNLSGGQKRRVSLATALIHNPPLLILDEPTVGVDPLLRESIWEHLVTLATTEGMTVVITTHYVEEARKANVVGLMRYGRLLAEDAPEKLMSSYSVTSLEDVFLKLCRSEIANYTEPQTVTVHTNNRVFQEDCAEDHDEKIPMTNGVTPSSIGNGVVKMGRLDIVDKSRRSGSVASTNSTLLSPTSENAPVWLLRSEDADDPPPQYEPLPNFTYHPPAAPLQPGIDYSRKLSDSTSSIWSLKSEKDTFASGVSKTMAIFHKNMIRLRRNLPLLLFQFLIPTVQVVLFCICIGRDPFDLPVAVYNAEEVDEPNGFGNLFLQNLAYGDTIIQRRFNSQEAAIDSVVKGDTWGAVIIPEEFSFNLVNRVYDGIGASNKTIKGSMIDIYPDISNQQVAYSMQKTLIHALKSFASESLSREKLNPYLAAPVINVKKPIYGHFDASYTEFMAPGVILAILYIMAVGLTALVFVLERRDGLLDRSWIAGVTTSQIITSHIMTQFFVMLVQTLLILMFTFVVFQIPCRGSYVLVFCLTLLQGFCGMAYGLVISAVCTEENTAIMMAMGSFYPNLLMSGIVWPVQAMPYYVRYVSLCLPQTWACESMRSIMFRSWDLTHMEVWLGFVSTSTWTAVFLIAAWIIAKFMN